MAGFNEKLLEHFRNPRNVGVIEDADGYYCGENPINGYVTDMYVRIINDQIANIKFKTAGCVVTIATASALSEAMKEKKLVEILDYQDSFNLIRRLVINELGEIPEKNWHCLPTAIQIFLSAIFNYYRKKNDKKNMEKVERIIVEIKRYFDKKLGEYEVKNNV